MFTPEEEVQVREYLDSAPAEPAPDQDPSESTQSDEDDENGSDPDSDDSDDQEELYDPSEHKVADVLQYVQDADQDYIRSVLDAEREGKNRSSLVDALEAMLETEEGDD